MTQYFSNKLRPGLKVIFRKEPYLVEHSEFVKPGKGQAFNRVKLRHLLTRKLIDKTFKSTDYLKAADIYNKTLSYLYNDGKFWCFIDFISYDQVLVEKIALSGNEHWLLEQESYNITFWNNRVVSVKISNFVTLKVIKMDFTLQKDIINLNSKIVQLSTGVRIKVPLFVQIGEFIKVDTRTKKYVSRII